MKKPKPKRKTTTPFTYYLYHRPTGKKYYGVRYAKGCHPEDLWTIYYSSSKKVKSLIEEYGKDSFDVEIRKIFNNGKAAVEWEGEVLNRLNVTKNNEWLNSCVRGVEFGYIEKLSKEHRAKISKGNTGKKHTEETKKLLSEITKKQIFPPDHAKRIGEKLKGKKRSSETIDKIIETKRKKGFWNQGKETIPETKEKLSVSAKLAWVRRRENGWKPKEKPEKIKKEFVPWNKGKKGLYKASEENKRKQSERMKGKTLSEKTRSKISESKSGVPSTKKGIKTGIIPWNKGKKIGPRPEEVKKSISMNLKGNKNALGKQQLKNESIIS